MSNLTIVLGNKNYSSWSLRPWLLLEHHNIPFDEIRVLLGRDDTNDQIARHSPSGLVPVLKDGDRTVWDTLSICEYVSETLLGNRGWPEGEADRARARSISAEMHSGFFAIRKTLPLNCRRRLEGFEPTPEAGSEIRRVADIWRQCRETHQQLGPWLFGEFSIADCMYAPVALRFATYGIGLEALAHQYQQTVCQHPAIVRWVEQAAAEPESIASSDNHFR
jgi:glutathione S-transferase